MVKRIALLIAAVGVCAWGQGAPAPFTIESSPNAATAGCCTTTPLEITVTAQANGAPTTFPSAPIGLTFQGYYDASETPIMVAGSASLDLVKGLIPGSLLTQYEPATIRVYVTGYQAASTAFTVMYPPYIGTYSVGFAPGVPFAEQLDVSGGIPPYMWSLPPQNPPSDSLSLTQDGILSGTITAEISVQVMVTDYFDISATRTIDLVLKPVITKITPGGVTMNCCGGFAEPLTIEGERLVTTDYLGAPYTEVHWGPTEGGYLQVLGTPPPTTTQLQVAAFPDNLLPGDYWIEVSYMTQYEEDVYDRHAFKVNPPPSSVGPTPIAVTAGVPFSRQLTVQGGTPPFTWSGSGAGLTVNSDGVLSGTLPTPQTAVVNVAVTDAWNVATQGQVSVVAGLSGLSLANTSLGTATAGQRYWQDLAASGGSPPYTFNATGLPPGIELQNSALSGIPTQAGTFSVSITVTDSQKQSITRPFTLEVKPPPFSILTIALQNGILEHEYSDAIRAGNGTEPYTYAIDGALPPGLALNTSTGAISGTPTKSGLYRFTATATDAEQLTASKALSILVVVPYLSITTASLPDGALTADYSATLARSGGEAPFTWSIPVGSLPPGLTLDPAGGAISGRPTETGAYPFTAQVLDATGQRAQKALQILITATPPLRIETADLGSPVIGSPQTTDLVASGGTPPYTSWSVVAGALPDGMTLSEAGRLSGTPTRAGTFSFTIQVTDSQGATATREYTTVVSAPPFDVTLDLLDAAAGGQGRLAATLAGAYPAPITGHATLTFAPESGLPDDPAIQFAGSGRTADFTIPANSLEGSVPFQAGTVAGTITFHATLNAGGQDVTPPDRTFRIERAAPVISGGTARRVPGGLEVTVTGFATGRDISTATFRFTSGAGASLQTSEFTVQVGEAFTSWYNNAESNQFGSQFTYTQPFTVQGDTSGVASVTVTLSNAHGPSGSITLNF